MSKWAIDSFQWLTWMNHLMGACWYTVTLTLDTHSYSYILDYWNTWQLLDTVGCMCIFTHIHTVSFIHAAKMVVVYILHWINLLSNRTIFYPNTHVCILFMDYSNKLQIKWWLFKFCIKYSFSIYDIQVNK